MKRQIASPLQDWARIGAISVSLLFIYEHVFIFALKKVIGSFFAAKICN